ncbi:hypothetical protein UFOVP1585_26 [uncultured Caudovirales phage]|uniref:Uncharacterized protein n=1 Tax=uncultured Caudovirales phage TaxID=2100421 RepID=A0A6J5REB8_9CAUD|nr:hypothetical protein UFOVP971_26 [uncultured Caudovirales phage]CAB4186189.1 hypothetical protein UFOVP1134_28 [uncultured Caudovirales phage]CAB4194292.1 hypothetical protein UFOVP1251_26 [uncultured Caudovirales phage]CAB4220238.1 hypothetical protein UFOVP1637_10 [uncultured Caudovirales phage]CAB5231130.1 hypothetical protein UFOVP1585_26 [uncultured Caudovirales phage]
METTTETQQMTQPTRPRPPLRRKRRYSPDEIDARVRAVVIMTIAGVVSVSVIAIIYSLIFVYQPADLSPVDDQFFQILSPLTLSLGGTLAGLAAGGAMRKKDDEPGDPEND